MEDTMSKAGRTTAFFASLLTAVSIVQPTTVVAKTNELPQGKPQTSTGRLTAAHATRLGYLNSRFAVMTTTSSNTTVCTHLVYLVASHILESHFHS